MQSHQWVKDNFPTCYDFATWGLSGIYSFGQWGKQSFLAIHDFTSIPYKVYGSVGYVLVGDVYKMESLKDEIKKSETGVVVKDLGLVGRAFGHAYFVKVTPKQGGAFISELVKEADKQPSARRPYRAFSMLAGGSHFFSEESGANHTAHRTVLRPFFNNSSKFVRAISEEIKKHPASSRTKNYFPTLDVKKIIRTTMMKCFFNTEHLPDSINIVDMLVKEGFIASFYMLGDFFKNKKSFKEVKENYNKFSQQFIHNQLEQIILVIKKYPQLNGQNLLADQIIANIKNVPEWKDKDIREMTEKDITPFLQDYYIKSIPSIFMVGDNITKVIAHGFSVLIKNESLFKELAEELIQTEGNLDIDRLMVTKLPKLSAFYQKELNANNNMIMRYFKNAKTIDGITIPGKSVVCIDLKGSVFSYGGRQCPGQVIAERMFKAFIIEAVYWKILNDPQSADFRQRKYYPGVA